MDELRTHLEVFADAATTPGIDGECPHCDGYGEICTMRAESADFDEFAPCPDCGGTGVWRTVQMVERCPTCKGKPASREQQP